MRSLFDLSTTEQLALLRNLLRDAGPRCGARTRSGGRCRAYPMPNGRCRMHGGKSRAGEQHGRYKHGRYVRT